MGFEAPPDANEAEFFQEVVTTPSDFTVGGVPLSPEQPHSPSEFAQAFRSSTLFQSSILPTIQEQIVHPQLSSPVSFSFFCFMLVFVTYLATEEEEEECENRLREFILEANVFGGLEGMESGHER